jgi:cytolethal distending toxin subunit A
MSVWRIRHREVLMMWGLIFVAPAEADQPGGRLTIVNAHSHLCLTPAGGNRELNDQVVQFNCDNDPSRFWSLATIGGNTVEVTNLNSGLCLTVSGGNTSQNNPSVQFNCDADPSRRWRIQPVGINLFQLVNVNSNLCLTIAGGSSDINVTAVQFTCDGDPSRNWRFGRPQKPQAPSGGGGSFEQ